MKTYSVSALAILASGCASMGGSDLTSDVNLSTTNIPDEWAVSLPDTPSQSDWLSQFNSTEMNALISEAVQANPNLLASRARAAADFANSRAARGSRLPDLSLTSNGGRVGLNQTPIDSYSLNLTTSWEVDIWGQVSKRISAADADFQASEAELEDLKLSIAGRTASAWINLSNAIAQHKLAQDDLAARARSRELTERRVATGLSTTLDVRLSRSAEASAKSSIARTSLDIENAARNLEVLLGRYPAAEIEAPSVPPVLGPMAGDDISPVELLARRPDVAAAEARMAAAGLRADLARIAMRPSLSLSAAGNINNTQNIEDLLDVDLLAGRVLANLTAPIFTGGRLANQAKAARLNAEAAVANYASVVLAAWQEVENARAADLSLEQQEIALQIAMKEAEAAEVIAERQYQQGLISIFDLINAQTRKISANSQLHAATASRAVNRINYHLALGGGNAPAIDASAGL